MFVRIEVRTVRFSTARGLRSFVRGGATGLRGCYSSVGGIRISLGIMGPRATVGGRTDVGILIPGNRFFTRGIDSAFRRSISMYMSTLSGRLAGCGRGLHNGWGGAPGIFRVWGGCLALRPLGRSEQGNYRIECSGPL